METLNDTIQMLKCDNEELGKENISLKRQIGGYITAHKNFKRKISRLVELNKEADEMYEKKIAELEEVRKLNDALTRQVRDVIVKKNELEANIAAKNKTIEELQSEIDYFKLPWWRRIF
jgi:uncharacterized coiled-coil DUF342 family protein